MCLSLQRFGVDLPVTRPVWYSNSRPPEFESRSFANCATGATEDFYLNGSATASCGVRYRIGNGDPQIAIHLSVEIEFRDCACKVSPG